jgi:hypothetical protein
MTNAVVYRMTAVPLLKHPHGLIFSILEDGVNLMDVGGWRDVYRVKQTRAVFAEFIGTAQSPELFPP